MRRALISCLFAATLATVPAAAQQPGFHDPLLERLAGRWVLHGTIDGRETTHDVTARWILNHGYLEIHEVSREKDAAGAPAYEAVVLVGPDPAADGYACLWLDTTSPRGLAARAMGHGRRDGDRIPFVFATDGGAFHTTFAYDREAGRWQWIMDGEAEGKLVPFARLVLSRPHPDPGTD